MLCWVRLLIDRLKSARLRCAARRYHARIAVIDSLPLPEVLKAGARERIFNELGEILERYVGKS